MFTNSFFWAGNNCLPSRFPTSFLQRSLPNAPSPICDCRLLMAHRSAVPVSPGPHVAPVPMSRARNHWRNFWPLYMCTQRLGRNDYMSWGVPVGATHRSPPQHPPALLQLGEGTGGTPTSSGPVKPQHHAVTCSPAWLAPTQALPSVQDPWAPSHHSPSRHTSRHAQATEGCSAQENHISSNLPQWLFP